MDERLDPVRVSAIKQRVDNLLAQQRRTAKWLYEAIGMSKAGYNQMWERDTIKVVTLQAIADHLSVGLSLLLYGEQETQALTMAEPSAPYGQPRYIEQRLEELETEVRKLKERLRDKY